jgi:hypothetical protein
MNSVPVAADLRIMIHELIKTVAQGTDIDCFNLYYYSTEKGAKKTYVHGAAWKTDRLALLDARCAGALDGGAVAGLWLPAPDLVCKQTQIVR